ncbi:hypothetical protein EV126DRAFT_92586 [Verticillium dahliae]|nr:hypothetical protein EV126DRAFT_203528 [Verticillium dahliae]KAH6690845.1 hypothetical protein EV126DRAFT_92586 [Verticillium dahliae]
MDPFFTNPSRGLTVTLGALLASWPGPIQNVYPYHVRPCTNTPLTIHILYPLGPPCPACNRPPQIISPESQWVVVVDAARLERLWHRRGPAATRPPHPDPFHRIIRLRLLAFSSPLVMAQQGPELITSDLRRTTRGGLYFAQSMPPGISLASPRHPEDGIWRIATTA